MPWTAFTAATIKTRLSAREWEVYQSTAVAEYLVPGEPAEEPDDAVADARIDGIAAQVLARFRGAILSNPGLAYVGPAGTLPEFCHEAAAVIGRVGMISLPPVAEGMTDPRTKEYMAALDFLKSLSSISPAVFAETETAPAAVSTSDPSYGGKEIMDF